MKFLLILFFTFLSSELLFSQTDLSRWEKKEISYQIPIENNKRDFSFDGKTPGEIAVKTIINSYWFFISEVDGANCPFYPSCSAFFAEAVKETNILQGTLMFFDRFTRDANFFKRNENYPLSKYGYFDPSVLYQLNKEKIVYIPPSEFINVESLSGKDGE